MNRSGDRSGIYRVNSFRRGCLRNTGSKHAHAPKCMQMNLGESKIYSVVDEIDTTILVGNTGGKTLWFVTANCKYTSRWIS